MPLNEKIVSDIAEKLGLPEVLAQFRSADTPAEGVNPLADKLTPLQVFQQQQLDERLTNERAAAAEEARKLAVGNTYGAMDKRILTETGVAKNDGESTVDYMARAAKQKFGTAGNETEEMQRLRQDVADKTKLLQDKNTELEQMKVQHATEAKTAQINARLDHAIYALLIDAPADRLDGQREFLKYKFMQTYEADLVDGKEVFKHKVTGEVRKDTTTASPMSAKALIEEFAPTVVSLKQASQKRGAGVNGHSQNPNTGGDDDFSAFATLDDYKKRLAESGVVLASKEGQDKIAAYIDHRRKAQS